MKSIDIRPALILGLVIKCIVDGGSIPAAIAIAVIAASQAYSAYLNKVKDVAKEEEEAKYKALVDRVSSLESKLALGFGSNRIK